MAFDAFFWGEFVRGPALAGVILCIAVAIRARREDKSRSTRNSRFFLFFGILIGTIISFSSMAAMDRAHKVRLVQRETELQELLEDLKRREQEIEA